MIVLVVSAKLGLLPVWFGPCLPVVDPSGTNQLSLAQFAFAPRFPLLVGGHFLVFFFDLCRLVQGCRGCGFRFDFLVSALRLSVPWFLISKWSSFQSHPLSYSSISSMFVKFFFKRLN